ncbi:hypothetical protein D3C76_1570350 [compost metagenome]
MHGNQREAQVLFQRGRCGVDLHIAELGGQIAALHLDHQAGFQAIAHERQHVGGVFFEGRDRCAVGGRAGQPAAVGHPVERPIEGHDLVLQAGGIDHDGLVALVDP